MLIAVPDMGEAVASFATGPQQVIEGVMSKAGATMYLLVVVAAIFVCCMSILTSTIRLAFGMARDDQLPFSKTMAKVSPRLHTPVATCVIIGALAAIPFIQFAGAAVIAVGATASIYFSYLLGNLAFMRARAKGWPKTKAPFSLGGWGKVVNVVAILWGAAMLLNFLTPSPVNSAFDPKAEGAAYMRIISNPKPIQTDYYVEGDQLVDFKIDFLNKIPVIWTVFSLIAIIGAIYYFAVQKKKPFEPVHPPEEEDLTGIAPATHLRRRAGPPSGGPASRAIIRCMKLVVSERAAAYIAERGGSAWVWLDPHRGLVGSHIYLEAHAEPPRTSRRTSFTRSSRRPHRFESMSAEGITLHYAFGRRSPPRSSISIGRAGAVAPIGSRRTGTGRSSSATISPRRALSASAPSSRRRRPARCR